MKRELWKRGALLALAAALLSVNAGALFARRDREAAAENLPRAEDVTCAAYQGVPCYGRLEGAAPDGSAVTYTVVKGPARGTVEVEGSRFVYRPRAAAFGTDRFTYAAVDEAGNSSAPATVEIALQKVRSGVTYADMTNSIAATAAQHLAEEGIFAGARMGEKHYFEPERQVLRSEFLAMALETVEREVTDVTLTGFCDDAAIPVWAKAYAAAGVAEGIVEGSLTPEGNAFRGGDVITFNEAAVVLNRVLGLENVDLQAWYVQREVVPSWAAQAVANLETIQVLETGSFGSAAMAAPVTRADAARMLSAVRTLVEGTAFGGRK